MSLIKDVIIPLLLRRDFAFGKFNDQRVFIRLLMKTVTHVVKDFHRRAYNLENLLFQQQLKIRVNSWLNSRLALEEARRGLPREFLALRQDLGARLAIQRELRQRLRLR